MSVQTLSLNSPVSHLKQDYLSQKQLFDAQAPITRNFLTQQARTLLDGMRQRATRILFALPDKVNADATAGSLSIAPDMRQQVAGGLFRPVSETEARDVIIHKLDELERNPNPSIATGGALLRFALAYTIIHQVLPDGRTVIYTAADGDEIPSEPAGFLEPSALTAADDAIAEGHADEGRVQVPFTPAARRFFLPKWVSFDEQDRLIGSSQQEAQAHIASMQGYMELLNHTSVIAPYMVADETYQRKRAGMIGQLINQGRALGRYQTREVITMIRARVNANNLHRGLSLSLPYFDDQQLKIRLYEMEVIPTGRIPFVDAFVVRAARQESARVMQDTHLSRSTRRHLLLQLEMLEKAFQNHPKN